LKTFEVPCWVYACFADPGQQSSKEKAKQNHKQVCTNKGILLNKEGKIIPEISHANSQVSRLSSNITTIRVESHALKCAK